jgi:hypothetical protein
MRCQRGQERFIGIHSSGHNVHAIIDAIKVSHCQAEAVCLFQEYFL